MPEQDSKSVETTCFKTHLFTVDVSETKYIFRVLKMKDSTLIYIGENENELFNEMGVAMPMRNEDILGTTTIGPLLGCDSQELATKLARRLKKQIHVSCNVPADRMIRPLLEKRLADEIKEHPDFF